MENGFVMKENFLFVSEGDRTEDCSLEAEKEFFRIGKSRKRLVLAILVGADIYLRRLLQDVFC